MNTPRTPIFKRLNHELQKSNIKPVFVAIGNCTYHYTNSLYIDFPCELNFNYKNHQIRMNINIGYPFTRPQTVVFDSFDYLALLCTFQQITEKQSQNRFVPQNISKTKYKDLIYEPCICCHSVLCDWTPHITIEMLLDEIMKNYERKMTPVWLIFISVIKKNFFLDKVNLEFYL